MYGTFCLYALWVTPLVQRAHAVVDEPSPKSRTKTKGRGPKSELAEKHLPATRWAWNAKYQTRTQDGSRYIFTEEWEQTPDGDIKFSPFAMIMPNLEEPDKPPYTLVSNSAVVQFQHGLDLSGADPGRIVGGSLKGNVKIHGPDGLTLRGKNFFFQETPLQDADSNPLVQNSPRAWSDEWVTFEYDGHRGKGFGLELELIPQRRIVSPDKPAVDGIRTVQLRRDVELHLLQNSDKPGQPPERVQVNSDGPFQFDLETHIATFEDEVRIVRRAVGNEHDTLHCDLLTLIFEPETGEGKESAAKPASPKLVGDLKFSRMQADGKLVKLTSGRSKLTAWMQQLTYDSPEKTIVLREERKGRKVHVEQDEKEFHCPELTLTHDEEGQIIEALGRGAGTMASKDPETNLRVYEAEWERQIWKHPDPKSKQQIIEFLGTARLKESREMALEAEKIKIWVEENRPETSEPARAPKSQNLIGRPTENFNIQRLLAEGEVAFASSQLLGGVQKLVIEFEEGTIPPAKTVQRSRREPRNRLVKATFQVPHRRQRKNIVQLSSKQRRPPSNGMLRKRNSRGSITLQHGQEFASTDDVIPARNSLGLRASPQTAQQREPAPALEKPVEPIDIIADTMHVRVIREQGENHVAIVRTFGHVDVIQKHADGEEPLTIKSDKLHVENPDRSNVHQRIWILGKPATKTAPAITAHVRDRGMHLEGLKIRVDRRTNMAWVDGAGLMQQLVKNTLDGKPLIVPEMISVWWREKMTFDGTVAKYYDHVRVIHEGSKITCGEMHVTLTEKLLFVEKELPPKDSPEDESPRKEPPELRKVVCKDGVRLDGRQYEENRLIGIYRGEVFELTMDQKTKKMLATGGGWIESWRRVNNDQLPTKSSINTVVNHPVRSPEENEWDYAKVTFRGDMTGDISSLNDANSTATTRFHEDVEVVYGPVELPTAAIAPDDLPEMGGTLECDVLRLTRMPKSSASPEPYLTMQGHGNAHLTGRNYSGRAEDVTYDQLKGQYVLRTPKPHYSVIWQQTKRLGHPNVHKGQTVEVYPKQNKVNIIDGKTLDLSN